MANALFLYNGGNYKLDEDDGRERIPQNHKEAESIFNDCALGGPTSIGAEFDMNEYSHLLCDLAVGDEIFFGLAPDAAFYRGIWMHMYNAVDGFTVDMDLVPVKDVWDAYEAGDACGVAPLAGAETQAADFTDGVGESTKDACQLAELRGGEHTDYRNNDGLVATPFDAVFAGLGQSLYMRITVTALGNLNDSADACCAKCKGDKYPSFKGGAIMDILCADKQRVKKHVCGIKGGCKKDCPPKAEGKKKAAVKKAK